MGALSSIKTLPADVLAELDALLLDPRVTQLAATARINARLVEIGEARQISKSAVNRYALTQSEMIEELAETRRVSEMLVKELGIDNNTKVGQVTTEMTRMMVFHFSTMLKKVMNGNTLDFAELQGMARMLKDLAFSHEKLERSASENEKRAQQIRKQEREEAAQAATAVAKAEGLSEHGIARIREALGMAG